MTGLLQLHESPAEFREALGFTEAETGFTQRLIEKDYYCSLVLGDCESLFEHGFVFKGGTSLSKYHAGFYRLSEDLDFAFSIATDARRSTRRKAVDPVRQHLNEIADRLPSISEIATRRGNDDYRQYNAILRYQSVVTGEHQTIKFQVALREPIVEDTVSCTGQTLIREPVTGEASGAGPKLTVLSLRETYAEKVRAALTRSPPAIRDIYDIDHAVKARRLDFGRAEFLNLVKMKLAVPRNTPAESGDLWKSALRGQLLSDLKPVLRGTDFEAFDLELAFGHIEELVDRLV